MVLKQINGEPYEAQLPQSFVLKRGKDESAIKKFAKRKPFTTAFMAAGLGIASYSGISVASDLLSSVFNSEEIAICPTDINQDLENALYLGGAEGRNGETGQSNREEALYKIDRYIEQNSASLTPVERDVANIVRSYWAANRDSSVSFEHHLSMSEEAQMHPLSLYAKFIYNMRIDDYPVAEQTLLTAIDEKALGCGDHWDSNDRRELLIHRAKREDRFDDAYKIAANHNSENRITTVTMEFLAGEIQLLNDDADQAIEHFETARELVTTPISIARMEYYIGRAYEAGDWIMMSDEAEEHYKRAARHPTTFYGQAAASKLGLDLNLTKGTTRIGDLPDYHEEFSTKYPSYKFANDAWDEGRIQDTLDQHNILFNAIADDTNMDNEASKNYASQQIRALILKRAKEGEHNLTLELAKGASGAGFTLDDLLFPQVDRFQGRFERETERYGANISHIIALARRESSFNQYAASHADAHGLMQMLPATATKEARILGISRFKNDDVTAEDLQNYRLNIRLGTSHLQGLTDRYGGSMLMATMAYNAGPGKVRDWVRAYGDPRKLETMDELIDWVENIPVSETREYVMRVLEGAVAYDNLYEGKNTSLEAVLSAGEIWAGTELDPLPFEVQRDPPLAYSLSFQQCPEFPVIALRGDEQAAPASLTKAMTLYVAALAMKNPDIDLNLDSEIRIPDIVNRKKDDLIGFKIEPGDRFTMRQLMIGAGPKSDVNSVITIAIAVADAYEKAGIPGWSGSQAYKYHRFVQEMRNVAEKEGMGSTRFMNVTGDNGNSGTPEDFTKLLNAFYRDAPTTMRASLGQVKFDLGSMSKSTTHSSRFFRETARGRTHDTFAMKTGFLGAAGYNTMGVYRVPAQNTRVNFAIFGADSAEHRADVAEDLVDAADRIDVDAFCASPKTPQAL